MRLDMETRAALSHLPDVEPLFEMHSGSRPLPILMVVAGMFLFITIVRFLLRLRNNAYLVLLCIPFSILVITAVSMIYGLSLTIGTDRLTGRKRGL